MCADEPAKRSRRLWCQSLSAVAAIAAASIAWWAMAPYGVGVTSDSVVYLGAAESIARGEGVSTVAFHYTPLVSEGAPLTIFPPVY